MLGFLRARGRSSKFQRPSSKDEREKPELRATPLEQIATAERVTFLHLEKPYEKFRKIPVLGRERWLDDSNRSDSHWVADCMNTGRVIRRRSIPYRKSGSREKVARECGQIEKVRSPGDEGVAWRDLNR